MTSEHETFGSYSVYEQIGKGGMATVHRAEFRGSAKPIALKRLLPRAATRKELLISFVHESRVMRYLRHPNIPETYDAGKINGTHYIAMELVRGPTLKELVDHCGQTIGTVPIPVTLNLASQLCDALDYAHTCCDEHGKPLGIIHRDISPANIVLSDTGLVKLIDFGLAKARVSRLETAEGVIKGKFGYVAPEYLGGALDARADVWAVGVVIYELLTSRRLFTGADDFETMSRVRNLPIPRPSMANPQVPPALDEIVLSALAREPGRRWQTAAMLGDALRGVIGQPGLHLDNQQMKQWVGWVLAQPKKPKSVRISQLAPMVPTFADEEPTVVKEPEALRQRAQLVRWIAIAGAAISALLVLVLALRC